LDEKLKKEIKKALINQPSWVHERAIQNAEKYAQGKLISKYESKDIKEIDEEDIIKPDLLTKEKKQELQDIGIKHLKNSKFAYFTMAGGISTSMGGCLKAILKAKKNLTFLEIKLNHVRYMQKKHHCKIPFILMTNEETNESIQEFLKKENRLENIELITIIQPITVRFEEINHKKKKELKVATLINGKKSYAPGGHYDAFILLKEIKKTLKEKRIQTIYITNIDNLGATINPLLLGIHLKQESLFTPEIAKKEIDDKGGTFAKIKGKIQLLEGPMVPEDYNARFENTQINKYFNTNLIYMNTEILDKYEEINQEIPIFINKKTIQGKKMFGFEAAIALIFGTVKSKLIEVPRQERFIPIKFLSDLWLLRSNFMILNKETWAIQQIKKDKPRIILPETFISNLEEFQEKIADEGETTNFSELKSLTWLAKDGKIGKNVTFKGDITITNKNSNIPDNKIITN